MGDYTFPGSVKILKSPRRYYYHVPSANTSKDETDFNKAHFRQDFGKIRRHVDGNFLEIPKNPN